MNITLKPHEVLTLNILDLCESIECSKWCNLLFCIDSMYHSKYDSTFTGLTYVKLPYAFKPHNYHDLLTKMYGKEIISYNSYTAVLGKSEIHDKWRVEAHLDGKISFVYNLTLNNFGRWHSKSFSDYIMDLEIYKKTSMYNSADFKFSGTVLNPT